MTENEQVLKYEVLKYVNRLRENHGVGEPLDELPKGYRENPFCCPVARAISGSVSAAGLLVDAHEGKVMVVPPRYILKFMEEFDLGCYPELEAE